MRRRYSYRSLFRRAFLFLFFLGIIGWMLVEDAQALRPFTSATDAGILDPGYLELEAGIGLGRNTRHSAHKSSWGLPIAVFNIGILENFELDIGTGFDLFHEKIEGNRRRTLGSVAETTVTAKTRFFQGEGSIPSLTTELTLLLPTQRQTGVAFRAFQIGRASCRERV